MMENEIFSGITVMVERVKSNDSDASYYALTVSACFLHPKIEVELLTTLITAASAEGLIKDLKLRISAKKRKGLRAGIKLDSYTAWRGEFLPSQVLGLS